MSKYKTQYPQIRKNTLMNCISMRLDRLQYEYFEHVQQKLHSFYNCTMRHTFDEQLQISEFIKDPASLKLLILAGTNIRANELITVNKCISLIKLDLSSNQLTQIPLKFINFPQMKIVYLHDNQITAITIGKTNLEYISLFDNPIKDYRPSLIETNQKLMAIDHHVVTKSQRFFRTTPHPFSLLKWPIVQISQSLEHEEDYLNLLKAELFVVNQVYKRANFADVINRYFAGFKDMVIFHRLRHTITNEAFFEREIIRDAAMHWVEYAHKKKKLRRLFQGTPSENLLMNKLERIRQSRSIGVSEVLNRFLCSIRQRMRARLVLERSLAAYRAQIPINKLLLQLLVKKPLKLYFRQSQQYFFQKLFLYAKKLFFNQKDFDILDNFDKLVVRSKKTYYIYRSKAQDKVGATTLMEMVKNSMSLVLGEKGVDKRNVLYNRQGHKRIQIKKVNKQNQKYNKDKMILTSQRLQRMYNKYDLLIEYDIKNESVYQTLFRLIKYFNAGNAHVILQNQAAYFQTEVVFQDKQPQKIKERLFFSCYYYIKRVISANAIQKWWRRIKAVQKNERKIFQQIRVKRAHNLIGRWLRDLTFRHRIQLSKIHSFTKSTFKQIEMLMQLDVYMQLPTPTDLLRIKGSTLKTQKQHLYQILHKNTEVEIVQVSGRSWIKVRYLSSQDALEAQKQISIITYRYYYNGTFIKLFTPHEINYTKDLSAYEAKLSKLFHIKVNTTEVALNKTAKKIDIENGQPYFIWPYLQQGFASMFKPEQIQSLPISVFIYNKNRRPLKVSCDLLWINPPTIYYFRKRIKHILRVRTPKKQKPQVESGLQHYLPHIRHKMNRQRQFSVKQHKSLLQANRQRGNSQHIQLSLLSQTLNIKRQ